MTTIYRSLFLCLVVYTIDSCIDAFLQKNGTLFQQLFRPEGVELYFGGFVLLIILFFGVRISRITSKLKKSEEEKSKLIMEFHEILEEAKNLKENLIICASCKKNLFINGGWQQGNDYLRIKNTPDYAYSLCPPCTLKKYSN